MWHHGQNNLRMHLSAEDKAIWNPLICAENQRLNEHVLIFMDGDGNNSLSESTKENMDKHYSDVIMGAMASQITGLTIVYSTVYSGADQRKHQSSASLAFVWGIHRWPVNSPHKWAVTRKIFPFDDVISVHIVPHTRWCNMELLSHSLSRESYTQRCYVSLRLDSCLSYPYHLELLKILRLCQFKGNSGRYGLICHMD